MSTPKRPAKKTAPKKAKAKLKNLAPKKNPKGGTSNLAAARRLPILY
jgi:hypothetical protein